MPLSPADPRKYMPSRADPEHRSRRKQLEKEHPFGWQTPVILGMLGVGLAWNIEKEVQKHEERKDKEKQDQRKREDRERRRRERGTRGRSYEPRRETRSQSQSQAQNRNQSRGGSYVSRGLEGWSGHSSRAHGQYLASRDLRDGREGERHQSVDYERDPRYDDRYYEHRYEPRYVDRYADRYNDEDDRDRIPRGRRRSRRDSF
ncbi:hypothetical protein F4809DRAFT_244534 [Biscogniauxia mediterranea]|nr:hypothetical protein F4809DRAFT_244534 [Biscogniauxia mediterranea]